MWKFFERFGKRESSPPPPTDDQSGALDSVLQALDEGESERMLPTLICRQCGLTYANTGTYLQGAKCPDCHPQG